MVKNKPMGDAQKLKEQQTKFGCLFIFKWLVWIESIQNKIKNEEILEETKKKKFWNPTIDLMIERPSWLIHFEQNCLNFYFIDHILYILNELPLQEDLDIFMNVLLQEMKREKKENFSARIEISSIQNYVIKRNLQSDKEIEYFRLLKENVKNENLKDEDILYSSRMISGCIRNFYIYRKLKENGSFPEEKEIIKFIKLTISLIEVISSVEMEIKEKEHEILSFELLDNNDLNFILINPKITELKDLKNNLKEWKVKLKDHLKNFLKIYTWFNNFIKKLLESSGTTLELMNKTLFDFMLKNKKKYLIIEVKFSKDSFQLF